MTMQADSHYRKPAESFLTLGWVVRNRDPKYWLSDDPKPMPGKQHADDLVCIPAHLMAAHTAIIAQSGSGKSFFLGRLVEELMLQTSAKCLILDPNADFRRIHETKEESLWKKAEYDRWERKGVLPHEATCDDFMVHWGGVVKRILTRDVPANDTYFYRELKISWLSLSMDFLAEDLDPTLQSDLYYCHGFVKAFKKVFKFVHGFADKDFLSEAQSFCRQIRELKEKSKGPQRESKRQPESNRDQLASIRYQLRKRFNEELINAEAKSNRTAASGLGYVTSSLDPQSKSESEWLVERFLDSALVFDDYVAPAVQRFYFGKARQLTTAGMIRSEVQEKPSQHSASIDLEVIDLPSLPEYARPLVINSILTLKWEQVRSDWRKALAHNTSEDSRNPIFIVVDEAHNLMPAEARSKADIALRDQFRTIIAEGRKYGLFLILVSQRPDKLDPLILSECENKAVMRLGSESVLKITRKMLGLEELSPKLLQGCLEFEPGRVLLAGSWCPSPTVAYAAARRTVEGGRSLRSEHWTIPREINTMNLAPEARAAAVGLFTEYRETTFVCGRRSVAAQAKRIAGDLLTKYRELHELTDAAAIPVRHLDMNLVNPDLLSVNGELNGVIRNHLRRWLGVTTGVVTEAEIADCLGQLIITMSSPDLYQIDAHLTGLAFDIHPPRHPTDAIERFIRQLNGLHASVGLRKETNHGEPRWHIQFGETSMASKDRPAPTS